MDLDDLVDKLPDDPLEALCIICNRVVEQTVRARQEPENMGLALEAYGLLLAFLEAHPSLKTGEPPQIGASSGRNVEGILEFSSVLLAEVEYEIQRQAVDRSRERFTQRLAGDVLYEFSDDDFERVQELINELRDVISTSEVIDEGHKRRLLKRLEKLQSELHKRMSDFTHVWALVVEAGVAMGKFGQAVKPLVDLVVELGDIVWRVVRAAEGIGALPSPVCFPKALPEGKEAGPRQ